jgi:NADPH-dependent curcumin reductase CurA
MYRNRAICLASYPEGAIETGNFTMAERPVPPLIEGEVLVKVHYTTIDPAMRVFMDPGSLISGNENRSGKFVRLGQVIGAWIAGQVVASRSARFPEGVFVRDISGNGGVQDYAAVHEADLLTIDPRGTPLSAYVTVLGMPGITAYLGMVEVARPAPGATVVISSAAGGVGGVAGQIAKAMGCRVIGIAGGPGKCEHATRRLGFDACIDYRRNDLAEALDRECRGGIDVYFDNVGGEMLDICLTRLATHGCVVGCGAVATYGGETRPLHNWTRLLARQGRFEAFSYLDRMHDAAAIDTAIAQLSAWLGSGAIRQDSHVFRGLDSFGHALRELYEGRTMGKAILEV